MLVSGDARLVNYRNMEGGSLVECEAVTRLADTVEALSVPASTLLWAMVGAFISAGIIFIGFLIYEFTRKD